MALAHVSKLPLHAPKNFPHLGKSRVARIGKAELLDPAPKTRDSEAQWDGGGEGIGVTGVHLARILGCCQLAHQEAYAKAHSASRHYNGF